MSYILPVLLSFGVGVGAGLYLEYNQTLHNVVSEITPSNKKIKKISILISFVVTIICILIVIGTFITFHRGSASEYKHAELLLNSSSYIINTAGLIVALMFLNLDDN
jgi:hypothetical protein